MLFSTCLLGTRKFCSIFFFHHLHGSVQQYDVFDGLLTKQHYKILNWTIVEAANGERDEANMAISDMFSRVDFLIINCF